MVILILGNDPQTIYIQTDPIDLGAAHWIAKRGANWRETVDLDYTAHGQMMGRKGEQHSMFAGMLRDSSDPTAAAKLALITAGIATGFAAADGVVAAANKMLASIKAKLVGGLPLSEAEADYLVGRI